MKTTSSGNAKIQQSVAYALLSSFFSGLEMCEKRRPSVRSCLSFAKVVCSSNFIYANISHSLLKYLSHLINTNLGTVMRYWARMLAINSKRSTYVRSSMYCGKGFITPILNFVKLQHKWINFPKINSCFNLTKLLEILLQHHELIFKNGNSAILNHIIRYSS